MQRQSEVTSLPRSAPPRVATRSRIARLLDPVDRWLAARRRARRRRIELDAMAGLSRHVLADIGIQRADVHAVAWGSVPAVQLGTRMQPAGAVVICCAAWPKPCTCAPCRPEPVQPQALPEAA